MKQTQWKEMLEAETLLTTSEKVMKIIYYNDRKRTETIKYLCNEYEIVSR